MKFNTKTIHGGQEHDPAFGSVMPPIYQTSTYAQSTPGGHKGYEYSRTHNPTRNALENAFASIENGNYGLAFGSGLAAIDAVIKLLEPGDEVILPAYTFVSTANAFILRGAKIVFCDSERYTPNMDVTKLESLITDKTKARGEKKTVICK